MEFQIPEEYIPTIVRVVIIIFSTLGIVYIAGRLLFPKMKDRSKNIVAFFALLVISFGVVMLNDYPDLVDGFDNKLDTLNYFLDSLMYMGAGAVFYVVVGWRFYSRMDNFLDKRFGKDDRRKK